MLFFVLICLKLLSIAAQISINYLTNIFFFEFGGQEIRSTVIFSPVEQMSAALGDEKDSELKGPVVRTDSINAVFDGNSFMMLMTCPP